MIQLYATHYQKCTVGQRRYFHIIKFSILFLSFIKTRPNTYNKKYIVYLQFSTITR